MGKHGPQERKTVSVSDAMAAGSGESTSGYPDPTESLFTQYEQIPDDVATTGIVFGIIIVCLGIFGNSLVVLAIVRDKRLRRRMNVFIASMAIADLLLLISRDTLILDTYRRREFSLSQRVLAWYFLASTVRNTLGLQHVVAITIYRYVFIVHNAHFYKLVKTPVIAALLVFMCAFPIATGIGSMREMLSMTAAESLFFLNTKYMQVGKISSMVGKITAVNSFDIGPLGYILGYIILNALILCACYAHLFVFLRNSRKRMQTWGTQRKDINASKSNEKEVKIIKTMAIVFIFFIFSYLMLPLVAAAGRGGVLFSHWVYFPLFMFNWTSSCSNWIIYALSNELFRDAFRRLLRIRKGTRVGNLKVSTTHATEDDSAPDGTTVATIS